MIKDRTPEIVRAMCTSRTAAPIIAGASPRGKGIRPVSSPPRRCSACRPPGRSSRAMDAIITRRRADDVSAVGTGSQPHPHSRILYEGGMSEIADRHEPRGRRPAQDAHDPEPRRNPAVAKHVVRDVDRLISNVFHQPSNDFQVLCGWDRRARCRQSRGNGREEDLHEGSGPGSNDSRWSDCAGMPHFQQGFAELPAEHCDEAQGPA